MPIKHLNPPTHKTAPLFFFLSFPLRPLRFNNFLFLIFLIVLLLWGLAGCNALNRLSEANPFAPTATTDPNITPTFGPTITRIPTETPTLTPSITPTSTPLPTFTPTIPPKQLTYEDPAGRFSLTYPDNWLVNEEDEEAIIFASDEVRLTNNSLDNGAVIFLFPASALPGQNPDPAVVLDNFIKNFVVFDSETITGVITATNTVNGQTAATVTGEGVFNRFPVQIIYLAYVQDNHFLVAVGMVANESAGFYAPLTERIMRSIRLE